jgi:polyhydroxyalkanoate synthesis repressor PhaR
MLLGVGIPRMQERLIRKYSNRRLYDTTASRHVTLEDLRQVIVSGDRIKVVDDKSGEDLTRSVLLQIIAEQEQFGVPVLGSELLEMIIRFYGSPMQALLSRYLGQAFGSISRQQEAMQSEMAKALEAPFAPLTELARQNMEMWEQMQSATRGAFTGGGSSSRADSSASEDAKDPSERPGGAARGASSAKKRNKGK